MLHRLEQYIPHTFRDLPAHAPVVWLSWLVCLLCASALVVSPFAAFYLSVLFLALGGPWIHARARMAVGVALASSGALIHASRRVMESTSDDVTSYFRNYQAVAEDWQRVFYYGDGLEPLLSAYFRILHILPSLTPTGLLFAVSILCSLIFWWWLERYAVKCFSPGHRALVVATAFLFFNFFMTTQLMRQMLAFTLLLHAISAQQIRFSIPLAVLAVSAHLTALPIYILAMMLRWRIHAGYVLALFVAAGIAALLPLAVQAYAGGYLDFMPGAGKLGYYVSAGSGYTQPDMEAYRLLVLIFLGFVLLQGREVFREYWPALFLSVFVIYLWVLPYPLMSLRLGLLITSVMTGFYIVYSMRGWLVPLSGLVGVFCIYRVIRRGVMHTDSGGPFSQWVIYPMADWTPLYYFSHFLAS